jgi:hypothetical protein
MRTILWKLSLILVLGLLWIAPGSAQEKPLPPAFATNTAVPPPLLISTPAAAINRYALRNWNAADLQSVLATALRQLQPGNREMQKRIGLIQYELQRRFPGAPRDPTSREALLNLTLAAPPGSVDMRAIMRPYIETVVNQQPRLEDFALEGFQVNLQAANLDRRDPPDALLHLQYQRGDGTVLYDDYLPLLASDSGPWRVLSASSLPAAPGPQTQAIHLLGLADYNEDGIDEIALSLDDGQLNQEIRVFGWRSGELVSLIQPGSSIRYAELIAWEPGDALEVRLRRVEDETWQCLGTRDISWQWNANLFRPMPDSQGWFFDNSVNCLLYGAEPIFAQPIDEALASIGDILALAPDPASFAVQRARMIQVMLQVFDGDVGSALALALELQSSAEAGSWLEQQASILVAGLMQSEIRPLEICAALLAAHKDGACHIDDALSRMLNESPLRRDMPIAEQLAELGIVVRDQFTVSQVGLADREVVGFDLAGEHWWAFGPLDRDFYHAEAVSTPAQFQRVNAPLPLIVAPESAYDALLIEDNPATVLTALDNLLRANPQAAVSPEVRYLQALGLDLLADRTRARQAYYDLWQQEPLSIWGQLAADHLEAR